MSALTTYGSAAAIVFTKSHVLPWSQLMFRPPSFAFMMYFGCFGLIQIPCTSTCPESPIPPASSSVTNVLPPSSDFAIGSPATYTVLSFDGSTRIWLKYIGRELQLLTCVHAWP